MNLLKSIKINSFSDRVNPDTQPDGYVSGIKIEIDPFINGVICAIVFGIIFVTIVFTIVALVKAIKNSDKEEIINKEEIATEHKKDAKEEQFDEYDSLKQYKILFDDGLITQEEYEKKKKQILRL